MNWDTLNSQDLAPMSVGFVKREQLLLCIFDFLVFLPKGLRGPKERELDPLENFSHR